MEAKRTRRLAVPVLALGMIVLPVTLTVAPTADGALGIAVNGLADPPRVELLPGHSVALGVWSDGASQGPMEVWLVVEGPGTTVGGTHNYPSEFAYLQTFVPGSGDGFELYAAGFEEMGYSDVRGVSLMYFGDMFPGPLPHGMMVDDIIFNCEGYGDVTVNLVNLHDSIVHDVQMIYQIGWMGTTYYVDADASGSSDGSSWPNAFNHLQDALLVARPLDEILVAEGTYRTDRGGGNIPGDRGASFNLVQGVSIQGGYAGYGEPNPYARDVEAYPTILSGDLAGNDGYIADPRDLLTDSTRSENSYHVLTAANVDATTVLDGLTITGGNANEVMPHFLSLCGGGMLNEGGSPTLINCTFTANTSSAGGGMLNHDGSPRLTSCTFIGNATDANGVGGGMCSEYYSDPTLTNCVFVDNFASGGGGLCTWTILGKTRATLADCVFERNTARIEGGGIAALNSESTLVGCSFGNNSSEKGAGLWAQNGTTTLTDCTFAENAATDQGGASCIHDSNLAATDCSFAGNSADRGGGFYTNLSSLQLTGCLLLGNSSIRQGGAMDNRSCSLALTNCLLSVNTGQFGAAVHNWDSTSAAITNCTLSKNVASHTGGGVYNYDNSSATLTNCILWGNEAVYGAQLALAETSTLDISHSTAQAGQPAVYIQEDSSLNWSVYNTDAYPLFVDPDGLDNVGGTEDDNLRLQAGSPCIDSGSNAAMLPDVSTDLDGHPRFIEGDCGGSATIAIIDMGAYEFDYEYAGDLDDDCDIDFADLAIFAIAWSTEPGDTLWDPTCNIGHPHDDSIDGLDLLTLAQNWLGIFEPGKP